VRNAAQKIIESLKTDLRKVWEMQIDALADDLSQFTVDVQSQISAISALKQENK